VAAYKIAIKPSAVKELDRIGRKDDRGRIVSRISSLAEVPRPPGCEKLAGRSEQYRIRQGDYRIVYGIEDVTHLVTIVKIGHRRDVYR